MKKTALLLVLASLTSPMMAEEATVEETTATHPEETEEMLQEGVEAEDTETVETESRTEVEE